MMVFLLGVASGALIPLAAVEVIAWLRGERRRPVLVPRELPPATSRKLDRVRRANRADLRPVLAAEHARRYVSPPAEDFDDGNTHP